MPDLLFLDAEWDLVTQYVFSFRSHYLASHKRSLRHTHTVHQLKADQVKQQRVNNYLKRIENLVYISGAGHGVYEAFKGFQDEIIWDVGSGLPRFDGIIVHLLSCQTGRQLGPAIIASGARAFWGYQEDFYFRHKKSLSANYHTDSKAKWAIYMDCLIDIGILQGKAFDDIYDEVRDYVIRETSNLRPFDLKRAILHHNFQHLVYLGDPYARI